MKIDHTEVANIIKNLPLEKTSSPKTCCPKPQKLVALLRGELSDRKRSRVIGHLENCFSCSKEIKFINAMLTEENNFDKKTAQLLLEKNLVSPKKGIFSLSPIPKLSWISKSVVAVLTIVILSTSAFLLLKTKKPAIERKSSLQVEIVSPNNISITLSEHPFTWNNIPDAEYSIVEISDDSSMLIWKSEKIFANKFIPSEELIKLLRKETTYLWMVTTYLKSGKQIESPVTKFSVK